MVITRCFTGKWRSKSINNAMSVLVYELGDIITNEWHVVEKVVRFVDCYQVVMRRNLMTEGRTHQQRI